MNIFINSIYLDEQDKDGSTKKRFPMIYFWLKDHYYQQSPENFSKTDWSFSDKNIPIDQDPELQLYFEKHPPDIVGLSLYLWNKDLLLHNARWIKLHYPDALIVAAGPEADPRPKFFQENKFVDIMLNGPSAEAFTRVIDARIKNQSVYDVDGICYYNGQVITNKLIPRSEDPLLLNYVENFRDEVIELIHKYTKEYGKILFLTVYIQGCPYSCSFCERGTTLWSKITIRPIEYMFNEIDLLINYNNITYEFIDANFGIVKEYDQILDYIIETNAKHKNKIRMDYSGMAKNKVDYNFYLLDKMIKNDLKHKSEHYGYLAMQDTDPEILKFNGRPVSKELEKIEKFKEFTRDQIHKTNEVDLILGMPGQSFSTLSNTLSTLLVNDLLSHSIPNYYMVFPNTTLTSADNKINFQTNHVQVRSIAGLYRKMLEPEDYSDTVSHEYIVETDTINSNELISSMYMFVLLGHTFGFLGWLRTPLNYLKNYHNIEPEYFVKKFTERFNPINHHLLPTIIQKDLKKIHDWFIGKDKYFELKDNQDRNLLTPKRLPIYRFHSNYDSFEKLFMKIFKSCINHQDNYIEQLMQWQSAKTLKFNTNVFKTELVSYNFDDIALAKDEKYYKSHWEFNWEYTNFEDLYKAMFAGKNIGYIPDITVTSVDQNIQVELAAQDINNIHDNLISFQSI